MVVSCGTVDRGKHEAGAVCLPTAPHVRSTKAGSQSRDGFEFGTNEHLQNTHTVEAPPTEGMRNRLNWSLRLRCTARGLILCIQL